MAELRRRGADRPGGGERRRGVLINSLRIGVSSYWFNRGQAIVGRHLRSALDQLGHETFVLARPSKDTAARPGLIERGDVWDQPEVTEASRYLIPGEEMERWARERGLDVVFFDQNYQFDEIARLREQGVRTIGRFVWEQFAPEHVEGARRAFDTVYSLLECEQERYAMLGIESPRVRWGCHPELLEAAARFASERAADGTVRFYFPGGYMTKRKPLRPTLDAFRAARGKNLRLVLKAQVERRQKPVLRAARKDSRIEPMFEDLPTAEHHRLLASVDVFLAPSRWEGLGLHLYEAAAFGLPVITNDNPPMNEVVVDGENGILVPGVEVDEPAPSGIAAFDPDVGALTETIERIADPGIREELVAGTARARDRLAWSNTLADLPALLES
jgi:1,2-diacylglycerol 3-alpha-glucosyltransferase